MEFFHAEGVGLGCDKMAAALVSCIGVNWMSSLKKSDSTIM